MFRTILDLLHKIGVFVFLIKTLSKAGGSFYL